MRNKNFLKLVSFDKNNLEVFQVNTAKNLRGMDLDKLAETLNQKGIKCFTTYLDKGTQKYFSPHIKTGNKTVELFLNNCKINGLDIKNTFWRK